MPAGAPAIDAGGCWPGAVCKPRCRGWGSHGATVAGCGMVKSAAACRPAGWFPPCRSAACVPSQGGQADGGGGGDSGGEGGGLGGFQQKRYNVARAPAPRLSFPALWSQEGNPGARTRRTFRNGWRWWEGLTADGPSKTEWREGLPRVTSTEIEPSRARTARTHTTCRSGKVAEESRVSAEAKRAGGQTVKRSATNTASGATKTPRRDL
jgi:hypothetical protein